MSLSTTDFEYLRKFIQARSAIVLETGKEYLIESRLEPVARNQGIPSLEALIQNLKSDPAPDLTQKVIDAMTTNETSFFRDLNPFEALKKIVIPELMVKRGNTKTLHIWSAACSSGQEPYTIAMLLRDSFPTLADWNIHIFATDLSSEILNTARQGIYSQFEVNRGLPITYLVKFFKQIEAGWQIKDDIMKMVEFRSINLAEPWPVFPLMDIIFIRNVMIYFDPETKKAILGKMRKQLKSDGYLFLGSAETTMGLDDNFERVELDKAWGFKVKV